MESYKLVNSKEVQEKAIRLGYVYELDGERHNDIMFLSAKYGSMVFRKCTEYNLAHENFKEITQANFLALPEPLKVGDWCMSSIAGWHRIFKIESIEEEFYKNNTAGIGFLKDGDCTKLTPEQIKVLGLEE